MKTERKFHPGGEGSLVDRLLTAHADLRYFLRGPEVTHHAAADFWESLTAEEIESLTDEVRRSPCLLGAYNEARFSSMNRKAAGAR